MAVKTRQGGAWEVASLSRTHVTLLVTAIVDGDWDLGFNRRHQNAQLDISICKLLMMRLAIVPCGQSCPEGRAALGTPGLVSDGGANRAGGLGVGIDRPIQTTTVADQ